MDAAAAVLLKLAHGHVLAVAAAADEAAWRDHALVVVGGAVARALAVLNNLHKSTWEQYRRC